MIFFSLTEPPHTDPTQHPNTRQEPPETDRIGLRTETYRNGLKWTFCKLSGVGDGGFVGMGRRVIREKENHWTSSLNFLSTMRHNNITYPKKSPTRINFDYDYPFWVSLNVWKVPDTHILFVPAAWNSPPRTRVLVEFVLITVTRFETFRIHWVMFSMPNMTGRPGYRTREMNGGSFAPYLARTPCASLFCTLFSKGGTRRAFRLPGAGGDHFHCTVEPSPGHIRCRCFRGKWYSLSERRAAQVRAVESMTFQAKEEDLVVLAPLPFIENYFWVAHLCMCAWPTGHQGTSDVCQHDGKLRRMSETPTTTTSQKSIAIHLPFVLQCASNLYCSTFGPLQGKYCQYSSHLYRSTPPICIAIRLPFVSQCFWEILVVVVTGMFPRKQRISRATLWPESMVLAKPLMNLISNTASTPNHVHATLEKAWKYTSDLYDILSSNYMLFVAWIPEDTCILICCRVIIWSKFGLLESYYLVQVCFFFNIVCQNTIK